MNGVAIGSPGSRRWGPRFDSGPFEGRRYRDGLRWIAFAGIECVRRVGIVIRDRAWRTLEPETGSLRWRMGSDASPCLAGHTRVGNGAIDWRLDVRATARGMAVEASMHVVRGVTTNRAGLVVLLATDRYAGSRHRTRHLDGSVTHGCLPRRVSAHQPVQAIAAITLAPEAGPPIELAFEGDVFEVEDQRNWLDPSFKFYNRALASPFPYRLRDGLRVVHRVTITLGDERGSVRDRPLRSRAPPERCSAPRFPADERPHCPHSAALWRSVERKRSGRVPVLGVATAGARVPHAAPVIEAVRALAPGFVLHRTDASARGAAAAGAFAEALDADLRFESFDGGKAFPEVLARKIPRHRQQRISWFAMYPVEGATQRNLRERWPTAAVAGGTFSDFALLNRAPPTADAERVTFALCPTVHARDDRSLIETLDALPDVFAQARRLAAGRPVDVGPCSLRRRLVPRTARPATRPANADGTPADVDPRQSGAIAAAWLACVVAYASIHRIASVCGFEAAGARGLIDASEDSGAGTRRLRIKPAGAVFAALAAYVGQVVEVYAIHPTCGAAFAIDAPTRELWLVELAGFRRELPSSSRPNGTARVLHSSRAGATWRTMRPSDSKIGAYGIARLQLDPAGDASEVATLVRGWLAHA